MRKGLRTASAVLWIIGLALAPVGVAAQDDAAIEEIRAAWSACTKVADNPEAYWVGWQHDFMNGYGENFEWYDGRWDSTPTVLRRSITTDAIVFEVITSCYRTDGSLAFIFTQALSPNYAQGGDSGPIIAREGRIYFDESGKVIRVLGQYADPDGNKLAELRDESYQLARGCPPVTVHLDANDIETEYFSVLGDIEGNHPEFTPNEYDWCGAVK